MDWGTLFPGLSTLQMLIILDGALQTAQAAMSYYAKEVIGAIGPFVKNSAWLFVMLYGFAMLRGAVKDPINESWTKLFKITVVVILSVEFATYNNYVAQFFWNLPKYLTDWLIPSDIVDSLKAFLPDDSEDMAIMLVTAFMSAIVEIMSDGLSASDHSGDTDPTAFAAALGVGAAGASLTAIVAGILLVAKFSLSILLALGPFFIVSILFEKTKQYFEGWLTQVVNFVVVILLMTLTIYVLFPVLLIAVSSYYLITLAAGALSLKESVELITLMGIFIAIIKQVPTTAAALVRGYAVATPQERMLTRGHGDTSSTGNKSNVQQQAEVNAQRR